MEILSLWLYMIFFWLQCHTGVSLLNNTINNLCRQEERQLLLQLKQQLPLSEVYEVHLRCPDSTKKTTSWNQTTDCCVWDGITCDESTGHVIGLDLSCSSLSGDIHANSSLFGLTHLRNLNLAYNHFVGSEISFKFGLLNSLTHLDLSASGFTGQIPMEFYHLSNLVSLDINYDPHDPAINLDIQMLFVNMTKIRVLQLVYVNISSEIPTNMSSFLTILDLTETGIYGELPESIFEKPSLEILRLILNDGLKGSLPKSLNKSNVHSIQELYLGGLNITGKLPENIGFMNNLVYMSLGGCKFWGPIPESIGNMTAVTDINLSGNKFSGQVPSTISNLRQLTSLDLRNNHLEGQLPDAFSDLQKLTSLYFDRNYLVGTIPSSLTNMSQLHACDISSNALTGPLPSRAGDGLQNLTWIDLSNNSIHGMIPSWLLSLPSLEGLSLSYNRLSGKIGKFNSISLDHLELSHNQLNIELQSFFNLSNIASLIFSYNTVIDQAPETINVTLPNLIQLELSSCDIKEFPSFLRYLPSVDYLDISNNKIHGPIPNWFSQIPWQYLTNLHLSSNYFTDLGNLPWQHLQYLQGLDLHSNSLRGTLPSSVCNMSQLSILNLSNNKLRGEIPECIGNISSSLVLLDLRRNQFHGKIPTTFGKTADNQLVYLGLNGNHLEGPVPRTLANCTGLEALDLGNNIIYDTFPWWLQNLTQLKILILKSNRFHGPVAPPASDQSFSELHIIDLSYNNFTGTLPQKFFAGLHAMKILVQSTTGDLYLTGDMYQFSVTLSMKGEVVEFIKVLTIFTTIDLSSNSFHGNIPESIAYLNSLRLLNLSHNRINGSIPQALAFLTNIEQLDLSSNQLTGGIPPTLTNLTFLAILNLSYNHLVGPIPQANQFPTFSNDSYLGNSGLCGAPLTKHCGPDEVISSPEAFQDEDDSDFMMGFTWKAVMMGYGCGLVFGFMYGYVMISIGKPKWLARFFYTEAAKCLNRRKKTHGRR